MEKNYNSSKKKINNFEVSKVVELGEKLQSLTRLYEISENDKVSLKKSQINCKMFLNMVIHDMRNPTNSI